VDLAGLSRTRGRTTQGRARSRRAAGACHGRSGCPRAPRSPGLDNDTVTAVIAPFTVYLAIPDLTIYLHTSPHELAQRMRAKPDQTRSDRDLLTDPTHRRYEALRAYLAEGLPAAEAAARFGYTPASLLSAVRDFRAGAREFFTAGKPGPKTAPGKDAARPRILALRAAGHSGRNCQPARSSSPTPGG
jgi:AraC-like DNA-binding protein